MIKTLSPHYKTIPWNSPSSATVPNKYILNVYVWSGAKASVPTTFREYQNINHLNRTTDTKVNISNYIKDFIDVSRVVNTTTSINDANSLVWVKTEVIYYINNVAQTPEYVVTELASLGYGYSMEGINPTVPNDSNQFAPNYNVLFNPIEQKVAKNSIHLLPFLVNELDGGIITVKSVSNTVDLSYFPSSNSNESVKCVWIDVSEFNTDEYIEILKDNVLITTLLITDEQRHTPLDIVYINKEGQLQTVTFFKEMREKLNRDSESYETSYGQAADGVHQFKTYNVKGSKSFSINSGFVKEDNNEIFEQFFESDSFWILKNNVYTPINLDSSNFEFKTLDKDRLINYKLDFKYSFTQKNSI